MLPEIEKRVEFLNQVLIFNEFDKDDLARVADRLKEIKVKDGDIIFSQDQDPKNMYIIQSGRVKVSRRSEDGEVTTLANFDSGDIFGEDGLYFQRKRSATITAICESELLYLDNDDFLWMRKTYPQVDPYLLAFTKTHDFVNKQKIAWLGDGETVSLVARRHPIRLIIEITGIVFFVFLTLTALTGFIAFFESGGWIALSALSIAGVMTLIGLIAGVWSYYEWQNDFFVVTNVRVVWRERIIFRSSSRQEVPLRSVQSINVQTNNILTRSINVGNVIVRTFNTQLLMTDVSHPERMKDMIDGFLLKARAKLQRSEHAAIRQTVRRRLGYESEEIIPEIPEKVPPATHHKHSWFNVFKNRVVEDDIITYRKHWFVFFKRAWRPALLFIFAFIGSIWLVVIINLSVTNRLIIWLLINLVPVAYFGYEYVDWRNDVYRLTRDQIVDREKKPLGKESFQAAPIKNIQSVGHEIPDTIGLILNVGNVKINVGDKTFSFNGVHDPALVHQDIFKRMEALHIQTERSRINQEHDRMATWLEIYHNEAQGDDDNSDEDGPEYF